MDRRGSLVVELREPLETKGWMGPVGRPPGLRSKRGHPGPSFGKE